MVRTLPAILILISLLGSATAQANQHQSVVIEPDAVINDDVNRKTVNALATLIMAWGYRCDSVSSVIPFVFSPGFYVTCNRYRYDYEVADKGGNWIVTVK